MERGHDTTGAAEAGHSRRRFPPWLTKRLPAGGAGFRVRETLERFRVTTVCQHARCPNQAECFSRGTATFLILGPVCTRACRFCAVARGRPAPVEADEPARVAGAAAALGLDYVVVTSVTRDDLPDGGAGQFAATIRALRRDATCRPASPARRHRVEVLTPDFQGDRQAVETVVAARPDVYNHNIETVPRLYPAVRPEADYGRSLDLLRRVRDLAPDVVTKSGLMVGLGERPDEVSAVMRDLRAVGCRALTVGQYLQPSPAHLPVAQFVRPEEFFGWRREALDLGFEAVAAGPFVRSSFCARVVFGDIRP